MKYLPHIVKVDGLWYLYSRREARRPVVICRDWDRFVKKVKKRHEVRTKMAQDRAAGIALRKGLLTHTESYELRSKHDID